PAGGEIDIIEGVSYPNTQATMCPSDKCSLVTSDATQLSMAGMMVGGAELCRRSIR
ncbi:hypothetical protein F5141DRAFT_1001660, partial [Pisolithus sp. B1]